MRGRWTTITVNAYLHSYQTNSPPLFKRLIHSQKTFSTELFLLFSITRKPVSANRETGKTRASNPRLMTRCIDTELATGSVDTQDFFFSVWDVPSKWVSFECRGASSCESEKRRHIQQLFHYSPSEEQLQDLSAHDITTAVCLYSAVRLNERPPHSH